MDSVEDQIGIKRQREITKTEVGETRMVEKGTSGGSTYWRSRYIGEDKKVKNKRWWDSESGGRNEKSGSKDVKRWGVERGRWANAKEKKGICARRRYH